MRVFNICNKTHDRKYCWPRSRINAALFATSLTPYMSPNAIPVTNTCRAQNELASIRTRPYVLHRANGQCEGCGLRGPFRTEIASNKSADYKSRSHPTNLGGSSMRLAIDEF
jgi:hypothetical protein